MAQCSFDKVLFLTDIEIKNLPGIEVEIIPKISSKDEYSHFVVKELYKYIGTEFILLTQHDAEILNGNLFDDRLFDFDYCGALWPELDGLSNGNGGFSWRSYRLQEALGIDNHILVTNPEDVSICRVYRRYLEKKYGLVWATDEIAEQFSYEIRTPMQPTFGRHGNFHKPFRPVVQITRKAAMGDVIALEPLLEYYHKKGYRVALDTLPQFLDLFQHHYFKVYHPMEIDGRVM